MMEAVFQGLGLLLEPTNIALILGGVVIGVLVGALPGLSSPMAIALLILFLRSAIRVLRGAWRELHPVPSLG